MMYGVTSKMGIETAMKNVCSWVNAIDSAIPLAVPINTDKNVPAQVGHAMNNPAIAPTLLAPLPFLEMVYALTAIAAFSPTKYETITCNTKLIGITFNPTWSVRYMITCGMYPGPSQHGATNPDGMVAP